MNQKMVFNKLVRDRIPALIEMEGWGVETRVLDSTEFKKELLRKLEEELQEYRESGTPEELTDLLEVLHALAKLDGINPEALEGLRQQKRVDRGGFEQRIFLVRRFGK